MCVCVYIFFFFKILVFVIISEFILHIVSTLSFYTHIFHLLALSPEDVLKAVIRNTDVLIFILVSYRTYIRNYVVFFSNSIARTYFNIHHYNFRILNPCRHLSPLLGPSSD